MSIDLSLDRIRKLLDLLPPYTRPTIHVAGTNGKGSVCALVSSILTASSPPFVVGRFNSPHLVSVLDCICIDNAPVSRDVYSAAREQVERTDRDHGIAASNFELLTCTALLIFERAAVDVVVLEVGMGGRLDATNAVPDHYIFVSALTAVDLDHQAFLGHTVEAITREKAAIARPGKPFVIGPQLHAEAADVARSVVEAVGAVYVPPARVKAMDEAREGDHAPFVAGCEAPPPRSVQIDMAAFADSVCADLPLHGEHQLANLEVAAGIISALLTYPFGQNSGLEFHSRITRATLARGILNTRWPGRLSYHVVQLAQPPTDGQHSRRMTVLADGAHNPASASALADYLLDILKKAPSDSPRRPLALTYILALSHSPPKTPAQTLAPLFALCEHIPQGRQVRIGAALLRFTPPEGMPWVRPVPPSEMRTAIKSLGVTTSSDLELWPGSDTPLPEENDPTRTLEQALQWAATRQGDREDALVVVAGSLYLVADFYRLLDRLGQAQGIWGAN